MNTLVSPRWPANRWILLTGLALVAGCAHPGAPSMRPADVRVQAAHQLTVAEAASHQLDSEPGRIAYNRAVGELTMLLRGGEGGRLWNQPLTLGDGTAAYRLNFAPDGVKGMWRPDAFTSFVPAAKLPGKTLKHRNVQQGVGAALVGVRLTTPREEFMPRVGITAAVTSTVDFQGRNATLALRDAGEASSAKVAGRVRALQADFSAPLAYYPAINETMLGLMGAMRVGSHMGTTGLYMLQPYDPDRIPIVFVHGLISVPQVWRNVVNELEADPELRGRYQAWVFAYPTGNPVGYSALRFREELAKVHQRFGLPRGLVLVGHSMGGLLSHMQATTLTEADWKRVLSGPAESLLRSLPADNLVRRCIIYDTNRDIRRVVFICTPHQGSDMAHGWIGQLGMRLITLPVTIVGTLKSTLRDEVAAATGNGKIMPNGVTALQPNNPMLKVLNSVPIRAPYHSIIGDRGRGDSPNSSDGVVPYWSSHLDSALSQKIVPGPHSSCELPETIAELRRILKLHLKQRL